MVWILKKRTRNEEFSQKENLERIKIGFGINILARRDVSWMVSAFHGCSATFGPARPARIFCHDHNPVMQGYPRKLAPKH